MFNRRARLDNLHRPATEHIGRAQQHRKADLLGNPHRLLPRPGNAVHRLFQPEFGDQRGKALPVLGKVDHVGRRTQDRNTGILQALRQFQRGLPAKLHDHARQRSRRLLDMQNLQHILAGQRLEIQPVGRVIIGRHRLRVAVDHDRFKPGIGERKTGVAAAIIEFDPLPDPVGSATQNDNFLPRRRLAFAFRRAKARGFIG